MSLAVSAPANLPDMRWHFPNLDGLKPGLLPILLQRPHHHMTIITELNRIPARSSM
jgi:hypothetical protein